MNSSLKIMWVEVGRPIPRYAKNNFKLMSKLHSNITQYLITDSRAPMANQIIIDISKMEKSEETRRFEEIKKVWPHKQEYFWHGTTARFFSSTSRRAAANFTSVGLCFVARNAARVFSKPPLSQRANNSSLYPRCDFTRLNNSTPLCLPKSFGHVSGWSCR